MIRKLANDAFAMIYLNAEMKKTHDRACKL